MVTKSTNKQNENASSEATTLHIYLRDVARYPLLTADEEAELVKVMRETGTHDEAEEAKKQLINSNLRLVVSIARTFTASGAPLMDMIQDGNIGLMRAVERFDPSYGTRLSTYATWWVRQCIMRGIVMSGRIIRLPVHADREAQRIEQITQKLAREHGYVPTPEEVARVAGVTVAQIVSIQTALHPVSLHTTVSDEDGTEVEILDMISDENASDPAEAAIGAELKNAIRALIGQLEDRERYVIEQYFGFAGDPRTYRSIGTDLGISPEATRQIALKALKKMRAPAFNKQLREYL